MTERVELKTERLLLRPFRLEDLDDVFEYPRDPEWAKYLWTLPQPYTREDAEEFVARAVISTWETNPIFAIAMDSTVIGAIWLTIHMADETASVGYNIARRNWGKGLATEAAQGVIEWGFQEYHLAKFYATADLRNKRSQRVMAKLGMTREGVLRSHVEGRGTRVDVVYYGLLREEWKKLKSER